MRQPIKKGKKIDGKKPKPKTRLKKSNSIILCSLHDIASYYLQSSNEQYNIETTNFIDNSLVCSRLANIREKLSESFDQVENVDGLTIIEQYCQNTPYWESPGDCCTTFWLNTD